MKEIGKTYTWTCSAYCYEWDDAPGILVPQGQPIPVVVTGIIPAGSEENETPENIYLVASEGRTAQAWESELS